MSRPILRSMRRCLALISVFLFIATFCGAAVLNNSLPTDDDVREVAFDMLMQARGHDITGFCIMNVSADGSVVGTVVNEVGVKAFDFTYSNGKGKVLNVIGPLNKWYIRKVLSHDFTFILTNIWNGKDAKKKKRSMTIQPNGDILVENSRYKISYTFTPQQE